MGGSAGKVKGREVNVGVPLQDLVALRRIDRTDENYVLAAVDCVITVSLSLLE